MSLSERYELAFAERGERIVYSEGRRKVLADFTSADGVRRFFPDSVSHWTDYVSALPPPNAPTEPLTPDERLGVLERILRWVGERRGYATHRGEPVLEGQVLYVPVDALGDDAARVAALVRRLREGAGLRLRFEPETWLDLGDGREIANPSTATLGKALDQLATMDEPFLVLGARPTTFVQVSGSLGDDDGLIVERRDGPEVPVRQLHSNATRAEALAALESLEATHAAPPAPGAHAAAGAPTGVARIGPWIVALVLIGIGVAAVGSSHLVQTTVLKVAGVEVSARVADVSLDRVTMRSGMPSIDRTATFLYEHPTGVPRRLVHEFSDGAVDAWTALRTGDAHRLLRSPFGLFAPMPASDLHVHLSTLAFGLALVVAGIVLPRLAASTRRNDPSIRPR